MDTIILGSPCHLHTVDKLNKVIIHKCEFKLINDEWRHVIHFKDNYPDQKYLKNISDITLHFDHRNEINTMEETVSFLPITTLSALSTDVSAATLDQCIAFIVEYLITFTAQGLVNALAVECLPNGGHQFLQTIGVGVVDDNYNQKKVAFTHNFRFVISKPKNKKLLQKQLYAIIPLIKTFLYSSKKSKSTICKMECRFCKLKTATERYLFYDYGRFHNMFCIPNREESKYEIIRALTPDHMRNTLEQLIQQISAPNA